MWLAGIALPLVCLVLVFSLVFTNSVPYFFSVALLLIPLISAVTAPAEAVALIGALSWVAAYVLHYEDPASSPQWLLIAVFVSTLVGVILAVLRPARALSAQSERRRAQFDQAVRERSFVDRLTGLPNRSGFLRLALGRLEPQSTVAILAADSSSPSLQEEATRAVGRRLRAAVADSDTVARWADTEFVLLCDVEYETGKVIVRAVHDAISGEDVMTSQGPIEVKIPTGASAWDDEPVEEAIIRARIRMAVSRDSECMPVLSG